MAGIYIHVPFCRQACRYCDFYFMVSLQYRDGYVEALLKELNLRAGDLQETPVTTVYLGGGTPSVLSRDHISRIMQQINQLYPVDPSAEITIEANPDDLDEVHLEMLKENGFNRLSIGVQSFHQHHLELMRRSHDAEQAVSSIWRAAGKGYDNINMDLIYGLPGLATSEWQEDVLKTMELPVQHISAYHLTYEPHTVFSHWKKKGRIRELPEEKSLEQYQLLRQITASNGFEHYEISNFAKQGFRSRHNSSYWSGKPYAGFGPSAHSFNGRERRWNIANLKKYINGISSGEPVFEQETLTNEDRYHDYLITTLRTKEGANLQYVQKEFGEKILDHLSREAVLFLRSGEIERAGDVIRMTPEGWLRSDLILQSLML